PVQLAEFSILGTTSLPFDTTLKDLITAAMAQGSIALVDFCHLEVELGRWFGEAAMKLQSQLQAAGDSVDLIASHGQTLFHLPPVAKTEGYSIQLGEPAIIADMTGLPVIGDFRPGDMAAGGHGAPLVPFADRLLFQDAGIVRAVQNIGGIANVTVLPATT